MTALNDLLVEIGTEELPPKALLKLALAFAEGVTSGLAASGLGGVQHKVFATPRRLAVYVKDVKSAQDDRVDEKRGPALQAAFKEDGSPSPASQGFARSCGTTVDALETLKTDKGAWLVYRQKMKGQSANELLPNIVARSLDKLPIPKKMRWGWSEHQFVRPVHWVVCLLGDQVVPGELFGRKIGRETRGHRFHCANPLTIPNPAGYQVLLETEGKVIADFDQRRKTIKAEVEQSAVKLKGRAVIDESLLDEVTGLVEYPNAVVGNFDRSFLDVPAEALISAMKSHQKYFHVVDSNGSLLPNFITISNIDSKNIKSVQEGNERVIRPRLTDADFFWTQDKKVKLHSQLQRLGKVVFQQKLGSVLDKVLRVEQLASTIANKLGVSAEDTARAAQLSKCDLMTSMVNEFPELQGTMGYYYAKHDGEKNEVALAIQEHYLPRFAGDDVASHPMSQALAIADKIDTITAIFCINEQPSGDKDPFGLRRAALGVLRTIIENKLDIDVSDVIETSLTQIKKQKISVIDKETIVSFVMDRLRSYLTDKNIGLDSFEAVSSLNPTKPFEFSMRVQAVEEFKKLPEATALAAANKRIRNILRKSDQKIEGTVDTKKLSQNEELSLFETLIKIEKETKAHVNAHDYTLALKALAQIRSSVDAFFDKVMVNVDDAALRSNRLALLNRLNAQLELIADISKLQLAGE